MFKIIIKIILLLNKYRPISLMLPLQNGAALFEFSKDLFMGVLGENNHR